MNNLIAIIVDHILSNNLLPDGWTIIMDDRQHLPYCSFFYGEKCVSQLQQNSDTLSMSLANPIRYPKIDCNNPDMVNNILTNLGAIK